MATVLIADDEPEIRDYLGLALRCEGYNVEFARDGEEVVKHLEHNSAKVSLLLMDLIMPRKDGFETLKHIRGGWPSLPVITLSGSCTPANVAAVMKGGAIDFLAKPVAHADLVRAVSGALRERTSWQPPAVRRMTTTPTVSWQDTCESLLNTVGTADVPVLMRGETGVGKEVLARKLHLLSKRANRPFLKLNCAALPSELVESELFGYERGAFTGAFKSAPGKFEMAQGGTILLDEIGDMDFKLQAKLLQVLQDKEFIRLGAKDTQQVDVRIMAATHCDLERAIENGRFREDLYYRLNIIEIHVPPLRERKEEILSLCQIFLDKHAAGERLELTPELQNALLEHEWPGNVRELENVIRKYLVIRNPHAITMELRRRGQRIQMPATSWHSAPVTEITVLPARSIPEPRAAEIVSEPAPMREPVTETTSTLADVDNHRRRAEKETILNALQSSLWNRKKAAALLQIDYKALLYKMKKLGIGDGSL